MKKTNKKTQKTKNLHQLEIHVYIRDRIKSGICFKIIEKKSGGDTLANVEARGSLYNLPIFEYV